MAKSTFKAGREKSVSLPARVLLAALALLLASSLAMTQCFTPGEVAGAGALDREQASLQRSGVDL